MQPSIIRQLKFVLDMYKWQWTGNELPTNVVLYKDMSVHMFCVCVCVRACVHACVCVTTQTCCIQWAWIHTHSTHPAYTIIKTYIIYLQWPRHRYEVFNRPLVGAYTDLASVSHYLCQNHHNHSGHKVIINQHYNQLGTGGVNSKHSPIITVCLDVTSSDIVNLLRPQPGAHGVSYHGGLVVNLWMRHWGRVKQALNTRGQRLITKVLQEQ